MSNSNITNSNSRDNNKTHAIGSNQVERSKDDDRYSMDYNGIQDNLSTYSITKLNKIPYITLDK